MEEPSIGLHMQDFRKLLEALHRLMDDGHTVVVIEHKLDIIAGRITSSTLVWRRVRRVG